MKVFVLITSYKEEATIGKAVEQIIGPNKELWPVLQLIVTSPDDSTLKIAEEVCKRYKFQNFFPVKDSGDGKAAALNNAVDIITKEHAIRTEDNVLIMTDGDMYLGEGAIKSLLNTLSDQKKKNIGGVGGHPVSIDSRSTMFGYFSHLFCEAAHQRRLIDKQVPMSGYIYAIRNWYDIFPIPSELRAEDAYISQKLKEKGYRTAYAPEALAYVKFPKNLNDWFKQKTRSLGGNVQVSTSTRSINQDLQMVLFPLAFAKNPREVLWSLLLYPIRLWLWLKIYFNHLFNRYSRGMWERIESSK